MGKLYAKNTLLSSFVSLLNERPFDRISVIDVTRRAGVSRNTFYYWYHDIYDLADDLFLTETQKIVSDNRPFGSWQEGFRHATRFAGENKKAIYHLFNSSSRGKLEEFLYDVILNDMTAVVRQQSCGLNARQEDVHDVAVFYSAALMGLVTMWLNGDMKQDADTFIENMGRLLEGNIRSAMERSGKDAQAAE